MKKLIAAAPDQVVVADVPMPEMGPQDVLIRGVRSLISPGSELNRVRRLPGDEDSKWPNHDLGYAMAGVTEKIGADVTGWEGRRACRDDAPPPTIRRVTSAGRLHALPDPHSR